MTEADPAASALDGIRADLQMASHTNPTYVTKQAGKLLKAVDAALKPHQPGRVTILGGLCKRHENHRHFSITSTEADGVRSCPDCTAEVYTSCTNCGPQVSVDACPTRRAITAALAGKGNDDGR